MHARKENFGLTPIPDSDHLPNLIQIIPQTYGWLSTLWRAGSSLQSMHGRNTEGGRQPQGSPESCMHGSLACLLTQLHPLFVRCYPNCCVSLPHLPGEELLLLQGISGCFRPGVLTALMVRMNQDQEPRHSTSSYLSQWAV